MHLQQNTAFQPCIPQCPVSPYHRQLDNIRCRPLNRGIHSHALSQGTLVEIAAPDGRQITAAAIPGQHIAIFLCLCHNLVNKALYPLALGKILVNIILCLFPWDVQILRQPIIADAVNNAEIDSLCLAAQLTIHLVYCHAENLCRSPGMDVLLLPEGTQKILVLGHVSQHTQLNLAVICRKQQVIPLPRLKQLPDMPALLPAHRDILQIRLRAAEPACCSDSLIEGSMHPAGAAVYQGRNAIQISGFQLCPQAVIKDFTDDRMLVVQLIQHLHVCRITGFRLFDDRQL